MAYGTGAILNDIDLRDIPVTSFQQDKKLPNTHISDVTMLHINDQGYTGSCVGQATSKVIEYLNKGKGLSARWLYGMAKLADGQQHEGVQPRIAAKVANNVGIPSSSLVSNNADGMSDMQYRQVQLTKTILDDAEKTKVGYAFVEKDVESLKQAIFQNGAIAMTLKVGDWSKERVYPLYQNGIPGQFHHYIMVYGYTTLPNGDTLFFFQNSWGEIWGNKGKGNFLYSDNKDFIWDVMVLTAIPEKLLENVQKQDYIFTSTLRQGMRSQEIKELQKKLGIGADGIFGPATKAAVMAFQRAHGLIPDGVVGARTRAILNGQESPLIQAIIQVESGGYINAIGDKHLKDKAYGPLQIRQPAVDDVNRSEGTSYKAEDMLGNQELSIWVFKKYMDIYAQNKTDEEKAKAWNGGGGWKSIYGKPGYENYSKSLDAYWQKVQKALLQLK